MTVAKSARDEMAYKQAENSFTGHEYPVSIPCQLRFKSQPTQDTERFHEALAENGFAKLDHEPDKYHEPTKLNWQGEITRTGEWYRVYVIVFRVELVRIFPHDVQLPTEEELGELIDAIETGFDAELEHSPLENNHES